MTGVHPLGGTTLPGHSALTLLTYSSNNILSTPLLRWCDCQMTNSRQIARQAAMEMLAANPLIIDTETTGLGRADEIVEIAVVDVTGAKLLDSLVDPTVYIGAGAAAVHGISDEDLEDKPTIKDLMPRLRKVFDNRKVLSYNFEFDRRLIAQSISAYQLSWPSEWNHWWEQPVEQNCIMRLYARYIDSRWQTLETALDQCGIVVDGQSHRALTDAQSALAVLKYMALNT